MEDFAQFPRFLRFQELSRLIFETIVFIEIDKESAFVLNVSKPICKFSIAE